MFSPKIMLQKLLTSRLQTILGPDYDQVMDAFSKERSGSFRINTIKSSEREVLEEFDKKWIIVKKLSGFLPSQEWLELGVFTFDRDQEYALKWTDAFYQGKIYLQSLASMLPVFVLDPQKWDHILDVCAAPGSKTTQMSLLMENEGKIVALEQNQIRFDKLMHNAKLQWAINIEGRKMDARKFFETEEDQFDRILLDAPCSAEGRIQLENEKSYGFWTLENIKKKSDLQYELISLAVKALKKWGTLVYSTCTLAPEENEGVISRLLWEYRDLSLEPIEIGLSEKAWWKKGITKFGSQSFHESVIDTVRILPSEETEGFYIAKIQKSQ
jgi:NOL1/NOP2/sun family putative RNA methylase